MDVGSLEVPRPGHDVTPANADLEHGSRVYAANCATCHGATALGGDLGPSLAGKAILAHPREYDQILRQGLLAHARLPGDHVNQGSSRRPGVAADSNIPPVRLLR